MQKEELRIFPGRDNNRGDDAQDFIRFLNDRAHLVCWQKLRLGYQPEPIERFPRFLLRDRHLGYEVRLRLGTLRFLDVRADGSSRSQELIHQHASRPVIIQCAA